MRIAVFAGESFVIAYNYSGRAFALDLSQYRGGELWYFRPATGAYSYVGSVEDDIYTYAPPSDYDESTDIVILVRK